MLIDIHCHASLATGLCRPNGTRFPTPAELVGMLDQAGIDRAVVLAIVNPESRFTFVPPQEVAQICSFYPARLIPFCSLDPRMLTHSPQADFRPMLNYFKEAGFKGVGEYMPNLPFDDPLNWNVFRQVEEVGFPLIFHASAVLGGYYGCYDSLGLPGLEKVLKAFPRLILLGHSQVFWSEIGADVTVQNRSGYPAGRVTPGRLVELMRTYPNLYGDLSAGSGFNAITRDPEFGCAFLEQFQDRLCFGTDISAPGQTPPHVVFFRKLREDRLISETAYEKIAWRNAARLLHLEEAAAPESRTSAP
jgi:hypothetical protein